MRAVTVVEVAEPSVWDELAAMTSLDAHLGESLSPTRRVALPSFERVVVPALRSRGLVVLARYATLPPPTPVPEAVLDHLPANVLRVLHAAQRHAVDGVLLGLHAWDPEGDRDRVRALLGAGLIEVIPDEGAEPFLGRYRLNPGLPPPPAVPYDFEEAVMDETDDLDAARPGPVALLHDLAALAAAIGVVLPKRTQSGTVARTDTKRLSERLGMALDDLDKDARWGRALRSLEALHVVATDPATRELHLEQGLEPTLAGDTAEAIDHLVERLIEADLRAMLPAVRKALLQAGAGAIDEVVFLELLRDQHREVVFPEWRTGGAFYPHLGDVTPRPYTDDAFEVIEGGMFRALLNRLARLGLVRKATGVFAATADGRVWAGVTAVHAPPVWVGSDLEVIVPPDAITPWERYQMERIGRCVARDVVDRYRLERAGVEGWLTTHAIDDALALLRRRAPAVPPTVEETLRGWARSAERVVVVRGVLIDGTIPS